MILAPGVVVFGACPIDVHNSRRARPPAIPKKIATRRIRYAVIHTLTKRQDVEDNNPMSLGLVVV